MHLHNYDRILFFTIAGIRIDPKAAVVATPEPEMAAKNMDVTTTTIPKPPVNEPTKALANRTNRVAIPPFSINVPAKMKNGIAINGNESIDVNAFLCQNTNR